MTNTLIFSKRTLYNQNLAERVGFEPTVPGGYTRSPGVLLQPLGHLSKWTYPEITQTIVSEKRVTCGRNVGATPPIPPPTPP